jgi:exopolyphosphatase/guanosine-5'-triphosphate,3'-diphosphate pyrophosphatase
VPSPIEQRELRGADLVAVRDQLGREPTTPFVVVARCTGGHPLVIRNAPVAADGAPFPTTHWLTCPEAVKAVSRIEAEGWIGRLNERYETDDAFRAAVDEAHAEAARDRALDLAEALGWGGVGGTRRGVKCLHAHYANHVAGAEDPIGAWVAERVEPIHAETRAGRVAAIDQGTNSCRLLVLEPGEPGGAPTELARDMIITRLGAGVDATGRLDEAALERTLDVLGRFCRRARALGAERIRVGATSAVRDAANPEAFAEGVRRLAGVDPEVIEGSAEATLSFLGGTRGLPEGDGPFLVLDIGGGSTELVWGRGPGVAERAVSTQMGSVRLTERLVHTDPPSPENLRSLETAITASLEEAETTVPVRDVGTFVSVAGTATTLQALSLGLARCDPDRIHRSWLAVEDVERVLGVLAGMTDEERSALPVMAPGRGDVIVAGAAILATVMRRYGFARTLVSETDILDGLAFELLDVR